MSGLLALLDDVAGIAKIAAASVDDVAGQAVKAGAKAAGAVIDDAAVTPKYVHGFSATREVPIVLKIARGSLFNKLVILLPIALLLSAFAPWLITPLLMIGGCYLCFEGAEKIQHALAHDHGNDPKLAVTAEGAAGLEEERVKGAIKTDFILSAEIMTIALAAIPADDAIWQAAVVLAVVAIGITVAVYGFVALIVKADDFGLHLAERGGLLAGLGRGIVRFMPGFMAVLTVVGTAAMIWVGGQIVIHGLHELGQHQPHEWIAGAADAAAAALPAAAEVVGWAVTAFFDGIFGVALGMVLIPLANRVILPAIAALRRAFGTA
jgi:predicted DNA repair protein MutK